MTLNLSPQWNRTRLMTLAIVVFGACWILAAVVAITSDPLLGVAIGVAPIGLYILFSKSWARTLIVVAGGLFVLGSSSDVSATKLVYSGLLVLCAGVSAFRLLRDPPTWVGPFRPLVGFGLALAAVLFVSYFASPSGADLSTFARQSIFYLILLAAPVIGLDSGRDLTPNAVYKIVWVAGIIASIGFATDWLERRNVSSLDVGQFVLSSLILPGFAFSLALVLLARARGPVAKLPWLALALVVPIAMLVTGTRTNLIIFAAVLAIVGQSKNFRIPARKMLVILASVLAIGAALFPIVANAVISRPGFIESRIQALLSITSGNAGADQSFSGRQSQYELALDLIAQSPVFGQGLGYQLTFTLDTPLLTVVRLGILGTAILLAFVAAIAITFRRATARFGPSVSYTAWLGLLAIAIANVPFGTPFEDRGFGFTFLLVFVAIAAELQMHATQEPDQRQVQPASPKLRIERSSLPLGY